MARKQGISWQAWSTCDRCGFIYPLGQLVVQKGLRVCTRFCSDQLDIEYRPKVIEEILSQDDERVPRTPELYATDDEEVIF